MKGLCWEPSKRDHSPSASWRHVPSSDNPVDLATRGTTAARLNESKIWWQGPEWLRRSESNWPGGICTTCQTELEARKTATSQNFAAQTSDYLSLWLCKFPSVDKINRVLAYFQRWRSNTKLAEDLRRTQWLTATELATGRKFLLRIVQRETFGPEIDSLAANKTVHASSTILRLSSFVDHEGLIRVGGRLQNSHLSEAEKHPIIMPSRNHIAKLLIAKAHLITMHGGPALVQGHLTREFWMVRGRSVIRGVIRRCVRCARHNAVTMQQQMAPLPAVCTRPTRPFTFTGVDGAGPFYIKVSPGRGQKAYKGYVVLFICLVVRAVHLEIVSDYSTASFLAAFRRFVARRGLCKVVYSDNAANFQGADAELHRLFNKTSALSQEMAAEVARDSVEWSFIPPRAPNFGGLWEANIKAFKRHLRRVVGETRMTYEELTTVASMIKACLNSRPLSLLSASEEVVAALTPGYFLIGASLTSPPELAENINHPSTVCSRWQLITLMRNHFWKRWRDEFLIHLQQQSKWLAPNRSFEVGDIVLFRDELFPPTKWPLARITRLYNGSDGSSRIALVKTVNAEYKRPVNKLILIPVNEEAANCLAQVHASMAGGRDSE